MGGYYTTDPTDPDAPVLLEEYNGIRPGDNVVYVGPAPLPGPLVVDEIYCFHRVAVIGDYVTMILNKGAYECSAGNLRRAEAPDA